MFGSHIAIGISLLVLVAAAALLGFSAKTENCCKSLMKIIAYTAFVLGGLNLLCSAYYTAKYAYSGRCKSSCDYHSSMMDGKEGKKYKGDDGMMNYMKKDMMNDMMTDKLGEKDANYDDRFISLMIRHHEAAVRMSNDALGKSERPEILKLAEEIIAAQNKEIMQMKDWRQQWYGR